jgi:hypothetical protein
MTRHDRYLFALTLARWGFAAMVAAAIATGLIVGMTVSPPTDIPTVALQSAVVYRVEVGGAVFAALYVVALAFALALRNRGFTEIGTAGIRAQDLATVPDLISTQEASMELLSRSPRR